MPSPFYNNIKGTCTAAPTTGNFTPTGAASGALAWSNVPSQWIGLVRFDDGTAWELTYCLWNGTDIVRASWRLVASSTGSQLSLSASATAAMVPDASEVMSHLGGTPWMGYFAAVNTTVSSQRAGTVVETGTGSGQTPSTTTLLSEQPRRQYASATTANAQAGWSSPGTVGIIGVSAGRGGFEYCARFGPTVLPTGPRLFSGVTSATFVASTAEPSAHVAHLVAFAKDSTDSTIQFLVNDNSGGGVKTDTGISLAVDGLYETTVFMEPGGGRAGGLIIRLDTGAIWYGTTTTGIPNAATTIRMECLGGLSATTGTSFTMQMSSMLLRGGT